MNPDTKVHGDFLPWSLVQEDGLSPLLREERPSVSLTSFLPSLFYHVFGVLFRSPEKKMLWIIALSIIASVAHKHSRWDFSNVKPIRCNVESNNLPLYVGVAVSRFFASRPDPTFFITCSIWPSDFEGYWNLNAVPKYEVSMLTSDPSNSCVGPFGDTSNSTASAFTESSCVHVELLNHNNSTLQEA